MRHMMAGENNLYVVTKNIPAKSDSLTAGDNNLYILTKNIFPLKLARLIIFESFEISNLLSPPFS